MFARALRLAQQKLLIVGDFNATHPWGYKQATAKGTKLYDAMCQHQLTPLTDPEQPTRTDNSVSKDMCPDLALIKFVPEEWTNTEESLGSDHSIIEIEVAITAHKKLIKRHAMTNWDAFRKTRSGVTNEADDLEMGQRSAGGCGKTH